MDALDSTAHNAKPDNPDFVLYRGDEGEEDYYVSIDDHIEACALSRKSAYEARKKFLTEKGYIGKKLALKFTPYCHALKLLDELMNQWERDGSKWETVYEYSKNNEVALKGFGSKLEKIKDLLTGKE